MLTELQRLGTCETVSYRVHMLIMQVRQTAKFMAWFEELRDVRARARIQARIDRLSLGNPGDVRPIGSGVSELRIDYGPGYRVYFIHRGEDLIVLLAGGNKN